MEGHDYLLVLAIIYTVARIGGYISRKLGQPTVLGEMLAGIVIGPSLLNIVQMNEIIHTFSELGVILLMFIAGLETDVRELKSSGKSFSVIAFGGVFFPFVLGILILYVLGFNNIVEISFVGLVLTATSVSITVQTLRELKQLRSKQGMSIMGAAIIDDVIGIVLLALFLGVATGQGNIGTTIWHIIVYFIAVAIIGVLFKIIINKYGYELNISGSVTIVALILCFALAFYAEKAEVAAITGAYIAGVIFSTTTYRSNIANNIEIISYFIFTPIFFVGIGMSAEVHQMGLHSLLIVLAVLIVAVISKVVGCGLGAKVMGFSTKRALQIGVGMASRGEVALIVTTIGHKQGILSNSMFSIMIFAIMLTSLLTPILLKITFKGEKTVDDAEYCVECES